MNSEFGFPETQKSYRLFSQRHLLSIRCLFSMLLHDVALKSNLQAAQHVGEKAFFPSFYKIFPASLLSWQLLSVTKVGGFPSAAVQSAMWTQEEVTL